MIFGEYYDLDPDQDEIDNARARYADMMAEESMGVGNVETFPQEDGSLKLTMDISPANQFTLIDQGMEYVTNGMIINDQLAVEEGNTFSHSTRTITITNEMANVLFHFGCIAGLKKGIDDES